MIWVVTSVALLLAGGAGVYYWRTRKRRTRLISFVALLREPAHFDPAVLAGVAGRAWGADLGDGSSEGPDGFVASVEIIHTIHHAGRMFLINSFPTPYVDDPDAVADGVADKRIGDLFRRHRAWFSCDALGVDGATPEEDVREWYRRLGKLFAGLLDGNCLLVYLPDSGRAFPVNGDTEAALRSDDPVGSLQATVPLPIIEVSGDDPAMREAVGKARETWPAFVAAFEARAGSNFSVKAPVTGGGNTEFIWITVTGLEGDRIYGELANEPGNLGPLGPGSKVSVPVADLNDWCYADAGENLVGGYTIEAIGKASRRGRKG